MSLVYFENILLGLREILEGSEGVTESNLDKIQPATFCEISAWEQKHGVFLTEEIRTFYSSSNGYLFEWLYTFSGNDKQKNLVENDNQQTAVQVNDKEDFVKGKISLNSLSNLIPVYGFHVNHDAEILYSKRRYHLNLSSQSKVFLLETTYTEDKVVLVYLHPKCIPTIWLMAMPTFQFHYLSADLMTYLKMAIAHLGIPNWQLVYTVEGVPTWTEKMFRLLIPHLLPLNNQTESVKDNYMIASNKLNTSIYKGASASASSFQPNPPTNVFTTKVPEATEHPKNKRKNKSGTISRKPLYYVKKS